MRPRLATRLSELLGIEYPVVQSGMGGVAGPEVAAAVSAAGGLGIVSALFQPPDAVRAAIHQVREQTDAPFGINLLLAPGVAEPMDPEQLPTDVVSAVTEVLDAIRADLDLEPASRALPRLPALVEAALDVLLEESIAVLSIGLGAPSEELVERAHHAGTKVMVMVTSVEDAIAMDRIGVDVIAAQGTEAGGHRSFLREPGPGDRSGLGTMALVPEVVEAVRCPVAAAGGIVDGRGLAAALALGAAGVLMGSRFVATQEAIAPEVHKKAVLERTGIETAVTESWSGWPSTRALVNEYVRRYEATPAPTLPFPLQYVANTDISSAAIDRNDLEHVPLWAGQGIGRIQDLPWAADVVESVITEARRVLIEELPSRVSL